MKKLKLLCLTLVMVTATALQTESALALSLDFAPASTTVSIGDSLDVDIILSGLTAENEIVSAFDLDVSYDSTLLTADFVTFGMDLGDPLWFEALTDYDTSTAGIVDLAELSFLSDSELDFLQGDSVTLATLTFSAIGTGDAAFSFLWGDFDDIKGFNAEIIYPDSAPVPEPATMLLFGTGIAGIASSRFRRKKKA